MSHTPTPWKVARGDSGLSVGLRGADGRQVASSSWHDSSPHYPTQATTIDNFEFIAAAVNSYTDHSPLPLRAMTHEEAIEAAAKHSYEHEGDRKGVFYIGWDVEPEEVKAEWRGCVAQPIAAYLVARGAVLVAAASLSPSSPPTE